MQFNYFKKMGKGIVNDANNVNTEFLYPNVFILPHYPNVFILPHFVEKVFANPSNKLSYTDLSNYDKIRKFFSLDDLAEIYSCYTMISNIRSKESSTCLDNYKWWQSSFSIFPLAKSQDLQDEVNFSLMPMLDSEGVINRLRDRLISDSTDILSIDHSSSFDIETTKDRCIVIRLKKGFIDTMASNDGKHYFFTKFLEALYSYCPIQDVSKTPVFNDYVKVLRLL